MDDPVAKIGDELSTAVTLINKLSSQLNDAIKQRSQQFKGREERWKLLDEKIEKVASQGPTKVILDVGGTRFAATKSTLLSAKDTFFTAMLCSEKWKPGEDGSYFIDRSPMYFGRILDYLRSGKLLTSDLNEDQIESMKEELDFYQIDAILPPPPPPVLPSFVPTSEFTMANGNKTITRNSTGHTPIRIDQELSVGKSYEWTIRIDSIVNSSWIVIGIGEINTTGYQNIYGISSANQTYPASTAHNMSGDWVTGDLINCVYKNASIKITNQRTSKEVTIPVNTTTKKYPYFDVHTKGLSITIVNFK